MSAAASRRHVDAFLDLFTRESPRTWRDLSEKRALSARHLFLWMVRVYPRLDSPSLHVDAFLDLFTGESPRTWRDLSEKKALSARRPFFVDDGSTN